MKKIFILLGTSLLLSCSEKSEPTKLVVGIVVDQMRVDYIHRFRKDFSSTGFNRLLSDGYFFRNAHYNYIPTKTGPGHASIYTGTTPSMHGIIGNDWFVRSIGRNMNCVEDTMEVGVGGTPQFGRVSPRNLKTTTVTDELRLFYNFKSKVVGTSFKDRGATLPAGHNPNGAYWYDPSTGNMMSSSYYMDELPDWVTQFNKSGRVDELTSQQWDYYLDKDDYSETIDDDSNFESEPWKGSGVTLPYDLPAANNNSGILKYTPFASTYLREFAQAAIAGYELGTDDIPDFLTISFSATDDLGHRFGPRSKELQDVYLRLDNEISQLLSYLDNNVGQDNYLLFLTADHGATDNPLYSLSQKMPSGLISKGYLKTIINDSLNTQYGEGKWVSEIVNDQVFLNWKLITDKGLTIDEVRNIVLKVLMKEPYIIEAYTNSQVAKKSFTYPIGQMLQNGYTSTSGDIFYVIKSGYMNDTYGRTGTDHRTGYTYDTHIPILFYGNSIKNGETIRRVSITDIAPTLSLKLNISLPSGATGAPLKELFE